MKKRISAVLLALAMLLATAHAMPIYVDGSALGWQEPLTLEMESGEAENPEHGCIGRWEMPVFWQQIFGERPHSGRL